jgi:TonB family protein
MISAISAENVLSWAAQVFVIASLGALLPLLFRLQHPRSHLLYCHIVLVACLVLPIVQPWQHPLVTIGGGAASSAPVAAVTPTSTVADAANPPIPWQSLVVWLLAAGMAARLIWFAAGLWQIRRYRAGATPLYPVPQCVVAAGAITRADARFCVSPSAPGPVTFGIFPPVVLLPESFSGLEVDEQTAIACHELLHVRRRDWLMTVAEELVSVVFWFNPAVWWLLAQTRLAREQLVDAEVVRLTRAREPYIEALLAMAGAKPHLDLAPAPLFLRRRHLTQRMHSLLSEVSMSGLRLVASYALMAAILAGAGWAALVSFPLVGEAQIQVTAAAPGLAQPPFVGRPEVEVQVQVATAPPPPDQPGISVNAGGPVLRRGPIVYPIDAHQKGIQGAVFVELSVNKNGDVTDARVMSGPEELRKTVLQSALSWRYAPDSAPSGTIVASVEFRATGTSGPPILMGPGTGFTYTASSVGSMPVGLRGGQVFFPAMFQGVLTPVDLSAVPEPVRTQLSERLRQFHGQRVTQTMLEQIDQIARETIPSGTQRTMRYSPAENKIDTALRVTTQVNEAVAVTSADPRTVQTPFGPATIGGQRGTAPGVATPFGQRGTPGAVATPFGTVVEVVAPRPEQITPTTIDAAAGATPPRVRVGGNVAAANLIAQVKPEYPQEARDNRIQGVVVLEAVIGSDGRVSSLRVVTGHPLLIEPAINAVKQWVYTPILLNNQAVEAITTVTVNFAFSPQQQ